MTRQELIEEIAHAIDKDCDQLYITSIESFSRAKAAITAIEAQGLAIVPVEATDEVNCSIDLGDSHWMVYGAYRAMIQAGRI